MIPHRTDAYAPRGAVKTGQFKVYSVKTIDEGIEVLTGTKQGEQRHGTYK